MRAKKRIPDIRKQSRIATPKKNIWFYEEEEEGEEVLTSQRPGSQINSFQNERSPIIRDDFTKYSLEKQYYSKTKKECSFVVDWQLDESF
jgi:hypothetical protein